MTSVASRDLITQVELSKVVKARTMVQQLIIILQICKSLREEIFSSEVWWMWLASFARCTWIWLASSWSISRFRVTLRSTIFIHNLFCSPPLWLVIFSLLEGPLLLPVLCRIWWKNHLETHGYFTSCLGLGLQWVRSIGLGFNLFSMSFPLIQRPILLRFCLSLYEFQFML